MKLCAALVVAPVLGWARPTPCRGGVCFYNSIVTQSGRGGGGARKQFEHCAANTKLIKAQQFKCIIPTLSPEQRLKCKNMLLHAMHVLYTHSLVKIPIL